MIHSVKWGVPTSLLFLLAALAGLSGRALSGDLSDRPIAVPTAPPLAGGAGPHLTLAEARARALATNPGLRSAESAATAARGALRQAQAWANPELDVDVEDVGGDQPGWGHAQVTWTLGQRLEVFGTRGARSRAARHGHAAAVHSAEVTRLDLLAEVDRRFGDAVAAQLRIEAYEATDSLAEEAVRAVTALVDAGEESPIEVDRTEAERALVAGRLHLARLEHASALRSLAQLFGSTEPDFPGVTGSLDVDTGLPSRDVVFAAGNLPDLRCAEEEVRRAEAEVSLSVRGRLPELEVRCGLKRFRATSEQSYVGGLAMSVPILDRRGGAIEEARGRLEHARAGRRATESWVALARASAYEALVTAMETSRMLRQQSLLRAEAVHASVQEGYQRGKFPLLDLIDARRFLLQARLEYIDVLRSVWAARVDLERLAGQVSTNDRGDSR